MNHQIELGYLILEVPDPSALEPVFGGVVGLVEGEPTEGGARTWRNDGRAQRIVLRSGPANDAVAIGLEAVDEDAYSATISQLRDLGAEVVDADASERRVQRIAKTSAPWGVDVEVVLGLSDAATPFSSALAPGGFLTDGVGFGHAVFVTPAFEESHEFLTRGLGFSQSDWLETDIAPEIKLEVRFYHCNRRHHSVAVARAPFELPQRLHHVMFELNQRDDVGAAFDRAWGTDLPITNGLGRHDNDGMFSFYLQTPAGFQVEIGHGARVVTDGWDDNRRYDRISAWGHQPLRLP